MIRSHTVPFHFKTVFEMCLRKTDRTLSSRPAHDPIREKMLCGWITHELARAEPDVFKVLKTYDEPVDFLNPFAKLLLRVIWQFLWGAGGGGGCLEYCFFLLCRKNKNKVLLSRAVLFSLFQIHLALSTPTIVDTFWSFWAADSHSFSFHLTQSSRRTAAMLGNFTANWARSESLKWTRSVFARDLELEQRAREWNGFSHPMCLELQHVASGAVGGHPSSSVWNKEQRWVCWDQNK